MLSSWLGESSVDLSDVTPQSLEIKNLMGKNYVLKEADGYAGAAYRSAFVKVTGMGDDVKVSVNSEIGEADLVMLSHCLYEVGQANFHGDTYEKKVSLDFIKSLPDRVQKPMIEWVKQFSALGKIDPKA
jgi:hypothetical protein